MLALAAPGFQVRDSQEGPPLAVHDVQICAMAGHLSHRASCLFKVILEALTLGRPSRLALVRPCQLVCR